MAPISGTAGTTRVSQLRGSIPGWVTPIGNRSWKRLRPLNNMKRDCGNLPTASPNYETLPSKTPSLYGIRAAYGIRGARERARLNSICNRLFCYRSIRSKIGLTNRPRRGTSNGPLDEIKFSAARSCSNGPCSSPHFRSKS